MKITLTKLLVGLFALAVVGAVAHGLRPVPVEVDLVEVGRGELVVTVDEDGKTRVRDRYTVSAPVAGRLRRVLLRPGDRVAAGQTVLAVLEPREPELLDARTRAQAEARVRVAEAAVQRAAAGLERGKVQHAFALAELERTERLRRGKSTSAGDVDRAREAARLAEQDARAARFAARVAEFELLQARAALMPEPSQAARPLELRSPIDGTVLRVFQESEAVLGPETRLMELAELERLEVEIDVLSSDGARIATGARVMLDHWGGPTLAARVRRVEPSAFTKVSALGVEEQRVNVIADLVDPPAKRAGLGDGFRVDARIVLSEGQDVLKAPTSALFRDAGKWAAFIFEAGKARRRMLEVGRSTALEAEVLGGLAQGERVIVHPGDRVKDGAEVVERPGAVR